MSKYTTEVRFICEHAAGLAESSGLDGVEDVLSKSWPQIFGTDFPIYEETHRADLCKSILRHYYLREIACETVGIWKLWLRQRMIEIMPRYNQLYAANAQKFDMFTDTDFYTDSENGRSGSSEQTDERSGSSESSTSSSAESNSDRWNKYSDTPQGAFDNVKNGTYLTNATNDTAQENSSSSSTAKGASADTSSSSRTFTDSENVNRHEFGKRGGKTYTEMLVEYRNAVQNVDELIIAELEDLFFGLW